MTRNRKCRSESNSFVAAAKQVCLEPVLEHRQRRSWCDITWQAVPHLCTRQCLSVCLSVCVRC